MPGRLHLLADDHVAGAGALEHGADRALGVGVRLGDRREVRLGADLQVRRAEAGERERVHLVHDGHREPEVVVPALCHAPETRARTYPCPVSDGSAVPGSGAPDPDAQPARWASRLGETERAAVLRAFLDGDGRLVRIPAKHTKRLVVLDLLAQEFVPGERYTETEVNNRLRPFHDDVAALRRYLVENLFLAREAGVYWRTGGSVDLEV